MLDDDWQSYFVAQVRPAFDFLTSRFKCEWVGVDIQPPECWAVYENGTTRVTIVFELGSGPRVELERKKSRLALTAERYDLVFLLMERAPGELSRSQIVELDDSALASEMQGLPSCSISMQVTF